MVKRNTKKKVATYDIEFDQDPFHSFSHTCPNIIVIEYDLAAV